MERMIGMTDYFESYPDDDDIRQGDIICRVVRSAESSPQRKWGVVITADCDIAQKKATDRYTWLEVIPIEEYLEDYWSSDSLRKTLTKQSKICLEYLNAQIKKSDLTLSNITEESLREWLASSSPTEIFTALKFRIEQSILKKLEALTIAYNKSTGCSTLKIYQRVYVALGGDEKSFKAAITQALEGTGGFPDFFFLPEVPRLNQGIGFVVLLRNISTLPFTELYKNEIEARVSGHGDSYYRVGRLSDPLRFSISQKMAFLFSRIGMEVAFEELCSTAIELSLENVLTSSEKN